MADPRMSADSEIAGTELLLRRAADQRIRRTEEGGVEISSRLFRDTACRPSVYRDGMCLGAAQIQEEPTDGIIGLLASEVRGVKGVVRNDVKGNPIQGYLVDVEHMPEGDDSPDCAHSEIFLVPSTTHGTTCQKLYERLARLAEDKPDCWVIKPISLRS